MIAGYAIGSEQGYVYVRAEYPIAVHRLEVAIKQALDYGILGDNAMGLGHKFNIELRLGAGAFVCGEETALLNSTEGKRGEPRQRPPFPAVKGLFGKPTLINNVETYANIAANYLQRRRLVCLYGNGKKQRHKGICFGRQNRKHRPCGNTHGHYAADDNRRNRRRNSRRQKIQSSPDRRPLRRMYSRFAYRYSNRLRQSYRHRFDDGIGRTDSHG